MKRALWASRFLVLLLPILMLGQQSPTPQTVIFSATLNTAGGPVIDTTVAPNRGIHIHKFSWNSIGSVTAGAIKLQQSTDKSSWSDCITAQTVTSSGGPTAYTDCQAPYFRLYPSTALTGTGTVIVTYLGYLDPPSDSSLGAVYTGLTQLHTDITDTSPVTVQYLVTTPVFITTLQATALTVSAGPAVLDNAYCTNTDTTNWAYVQLFNNTSPTVGSTAPDAVMGVPPASGSAPAERNWNFATAIKVAATTTPTGSTNAVTALNCTFGTRAIP